jgi:HEAT repeat protein
MGNDSALPDRPKHIRVFANDARERGDVDSLLALLTSTDVAARETAIYNLGKLGDSTASEPLKRFLNSNDQGVRILVLRALARIGDRSVIPDVYESAVEDASFLVRVTAMKTLATLGDRRAVELLGSALNEEGVPDPRWFRNWASKVLIELGGVGAIPNLEAALRDAGPIGRLRLKRAIRTLKRL